MRALLALLLLVCVCTGTQARTITHGRFQGVRIVAPSQRVEQFVLLLADGAEEGARLATTLASQGALVATIDTRALFAALERDGAECVSPNGDLENLAHYVQAMEHLDSYHTPLLIGAGVGAPFVYAMLAQSPADTFAGGMSVRFCPQLALRKPLCEGQHLKYESRARNTLTPARLERPWKVLGVAPAACADAARTFAAQAGAPIEPVDATSLSARVASAYTQLASGATPRTGGARPLADLPLIEVPSAVAGDTFAVMLSGDGGWAGLDKEVARAVAAAGIPVVGFDSLRYFWTKRTPEDLARDLGRVVRTYVQLWRRPRVVVIGYSRGADVVPFGINRLDAATRSRVSSVVLIGLTKTASFEFHVGNWIGLGARGALPIAPEMAKLRLETVVCIQGADDAESTCGAYANTAARVVKLPGSHHFNGDYPGLASTIVREIKALQGR